MTIIIPVWLLWIIGIGGGIVLVFFAVIGVMYFLALSQWKWF